MTAAALIAFTAPGAAGSADDTMAGRGLYIRYLERTEATYTEIVVANGRVRNQYSEDATGRCARWIEQRPCWTAEDLSLAEAEIVPAQLDDLIVLVDRGGYMDLSPSYGDAAAGQRFYPMEIAVRFAGRERAVIYQAFPDSAPMPVAFARLRARLDELARTAVYRRNVP